MKKRMTQSEFNEGITMVVTCMAQIVWGLAKIRIYEMSDNPITEPAAQMLKEKCDQLVKHLREFGVKTEPFEEYEIKQEAEKNPNN
jgi:hypothetical protein